MASTISLEGIASVGGNEDRALAHLKVEYNGNTYNWQIYVPSGADLQTFLADANTSAAVESQIDSKEAIWAALNPKTRTIVGSGIMGNPDITVNLSKEEVVKPDIPDYYAQRRDAYPSVGEQMGAIFKGIGSPEYAVVQQKIADVKAKYPKP